MEVYSFDVGRKVWTGLTVIESPSKRTKEVGDGSKGGRLKCVVKELCIK